MSRCYALSDRIAGTQKATLSANNGREQMQQTGRYSTTSSARSRSDSGIVKRSALAVLRLTTSSNLVGCSTGGRLRAAVQLDQLADKYAFPDPLKAGASARSINVSEKLRNLGRACFAAPRPPLKSKLRAERADVQG